MFIFLILNKFTLKLYSTEKPESILEKPVGNQYQTLQLSSPETGELFRLIKN